MNRRQELTNLYGKIVKEFPFLANQGLLRPDDRKVSIDDLLSMSVFGQPKMGKKWEECNEQQHSLEFTILYNTYHIIIVTVYRIIMKFKS